MLFKRTKSYEGFSPALDKNRLIILTKKLLPDMVFNMASLEGNPFTYHVASESSKACPHKEPRVE